MPEKINFSIPEAGTSLKIKKREGISHAILRKGANLDENLEVSEIEEIFRSLEKDTQNQIKTLAFEIEKNLGKPVYEGNEFKIPENLILEIQKENINNTKQNIENLNLKKEEGENKLKEQDATIENLEKKLSKLKGDQENDKQEGENNNLEELKSDVNARKEKIKNLEKLLTEAEEEIKNQNQKIENLEEKIKKLEKGQNSENSTEGETQSIIPKDETASQNISSDTQEQAKETENNEKSSQGETQNVTQENKTTEQNISSNSQEQTNQNPEKKDTEIPKQEETKKTENKSDIFEEKDGFLQLKNKITNYEELKGKKIENLNINNKEDLKILEYIDKDSLKKLNMNALGLTNEDIKILSNFKNLTELSLLQNNITDITPLSSLTNLTWITLDNNDIKDYSPLKNLTKLTNKEKYLKEETENNKDPYPTLEQELKAKIETENYDFDGIWSGEEKSRSTFIKRVIELYKESNLYKQGGKFDIGELLNNISDRGKNISYSHNYSNKNSQKIEGKIKNFFDANTQKE